jgi:hypothetical protein
METLLIEHLRANGYLPAPGVRFRGVKGKK